MDRPADSRYYSVFYTFPPWKNVASNPAYSRYYLVLYILKESAKKSAILQAAGIFSRVTTTAGYTLLNLGPANSRYY